ncbi:hypothetical protein [Microbacterium sp. A94]|uniref:hypothetical protein n=1 Tax=Microbacterium sp. A94 TaxID=3450717 RepID=UPI003F434F6D
MVDDSVIEEAAQEISVAKMHGEWTDAAHAAFAVFEKAYAPTDNEQEAAAERIIGRHLSRLSKREGWSEDDTAIGGQAANIVRQLTEAGLFHRCEVPEPQGEPSDAQVRAAIDAWHRTEGAGHADWYQNPINRDRMRAALRAAGEVKR